MIETLVTVVLKKCLEAIAPKNHSKINLLVLCSMM